MGMSLNTEYLLLEEEQFKKLKSGQLLLKSKYDLKLISAIEAEEYKKARMFDALKEFCCSYNDLKEAICSPYNNLEEFIIGERLLDDEYELPVTLDEFLNEDNYCGEWTVNELHEEYINNKDCYLLIQTRYW